MRFAHTIIRCKFLMVLICCGAVGCQPGQNAQMPVPGMELYAVVPERIIEVLVSSPDYKLYAYRWKPEGTFHLTITSVETTTEEHCLAGNEFRKWLETVATARVTKEMVSSVASKNPRWTSIRLQDVSDLEPIEVRFLIPQSDTDPVVIQFGTKQFAVDMDSAILRSARSGCNVLSK